MLVLHYLKLFALSLTALLAFEQIPTIKTIEPGFSEASQLLSVLSEFASGAKEVIVEMLTRPSDFFHTNKSNRNPLVLALPPPPPPPPVASSESPSDPPLEPPPESLPEPLQSPEPMHLANSTSHFWRIDGTKVILELDLESVPGFDATRTAVLWVAHWYGALFPGGFGVGRTGQSYWLYALASAALGFFGGLGYGFAGWCRWWLSERKVPQTVEEKVEQVVIPKHTARRDPADAYHESRLSQSYMMPLNFQHVPDPRLFLRVSAPIAATKSEQAEDIDTTIDRIAKKEEDSDPLMVPPSFSDSSWYSPGSPSSPTQSSDTGLDLSSYGEFQPEPRSPHPGGLPDTLLGSFPLIAPPPREPALPQLPDPWNNYTPTDRVDLS